MRPFRAVLADLAEAEPNAFYVTVYDFARDRARDWLDTIRATMSRVTGRLELRYAGHLLAAAEDGHGIARDEPLTRNFE